VPPLLGRRGQWHVILAANAQAVGDLDVGCHGGRHPDGPGPGSPAGRPAMQFDMASSHGEDVELDILEGRVVGQGLLDPGRGLPCRGRGRLLTGQAGHHVGDPPAVQLTDEPPEQKPATKPNPSPEAAYQRSSARPERRAESLRMWLT